MDLQVYNMDDLFIHYLARLNEVYPFIRLKMDDSSTTISLGFEHYDISKKESHQEFAPFKKYSISVNFQRIEDTIKEITKFSNCTITAENELLMERKSPLNSRYFIVKDEVPEVFSKKFLEYLETHKRVILSVFKVRFLKMKDGEDIWWSNPTPLQTRNATEAFPLLGCGPLYRGGHDANVTVEKSLMTSICEIQHLDKEKFDVFFLNEGIHSVVFEIINKTL